MLNVMSCAVAGPLLIVVEYAPHGNMRQFLYKQRPPQPTDYLMPAGSSCERSIVPLRADDLLKFAYQIACGMEYIASKNVRTLLVEQSFCRPWQMWVIHYIYYSAK